MAYVITQNCCNDASCVAACPVGCIHPTPSEPGFGTAELLHIDPRTCIDCGACADACPVDAIRPDTELTANDEPFRALNADYFQEHSVPPAFLRRRAPQIVTTGLPLRVAIVGSGPAALYCAKELLNQPGVYVDMFEKLPSPHGLIRYGVAPDHPDTKAVVDQFRWLPEQLRRFTLHLGVEVGSDTSHDELVDRYDAVLYATGAFTSRPLGIPGERLPGSVSATSFVGWYNGHPDHTELAPDLLTRRAVVVGNGNVALDIARMLTTDPELLLHGSIPTGVLSTLRASRIEEVVVLGRRGPVDAAFSTPELLGLTQVPGVDVIVDGDVPSDAGAVAEPVARAKLRLLQEMAASHARPGHRRIVLRFDTRPEEILGTRRVTGVRVIGRCGDEDCIDTGIILRANGFRGVAVPGVPFDDVTNTIPNVEGRIVDADGVPVRGAYAAGWIKRGPSGVIGTNRSCAQQTVGHLLADHLAGRPTEPKSGDRARRRSRGVALAFGRRV